MWSNHVVLPTCPRRYNSTRQRLVEVNEEAASLRGAMSQRDRDLAAERDITTRLTSERNKVFGGSARISRCDANEPPYDDPSVQTCVTLFFRATGVPDS